MKSIHVNWRLCRTPSDWIVHTLRMGQTINTTTMMVPTSSKPSISLLFRKERLHRPSPVHGNLDAIRLNCLNSIEVAVDLRSAWCAKHPSPKKWPALKMAHRRFHGVE